jgi:hypothetical protein
MTNFAMFTDAGNDAVGSIVRLAITQNLSWTVVQGLLKALSQDERFEEVNDTAVREAVYRACDFS